MAQADAKVGRDYVRALLYASSGDTDLQVAALENVAAAYPRSSQAAKALLTAGNVQRNRGNLGEADSAYRRVLTLPSSTRLPRGLAHKALGDMRREQVGEDEVVLYHYTQAARELKAETKQPRSDTKAKAFMALAEVEQSMGNDESAVANYAEAARANPAPSTSGQVEARLASVL